MQQDFCRISSLNLCESDVESLLRSLKMHSFLKLMFTEHLFFYQVTIPACPPCEVKSVEELVAQSCPTLCNPMDCSPPDSSVHGILQARTLKWVAISCSWGSSPPRDWTHVSCISCIGRWILYHWATWEAWSVYHLQIFIWLALYWEILPTQQERHTTSSSWHLFIL